MLTPAASTAADSQTKLNILLCLQVCGENKENVDLF